MDTNGQWLTEVGGVVQDGLQCVSFKSLEGALAVFSCREGHHHGHYAGPGLRAHEFGSRLDELTHQVVHSRGLAAIATFQGSRRKEL